LKEIVAPLEREKKPIIIIDNGLICLWRKKIQKKNNDHGVDVSIIIII
jgi:hypothetical protein